MTKDDRMLTGAQVRARLGISKTALWEGCRQGTYPAPLRFGPRTVRWLESEIEDFIEEAKAARKVA
ncbi:helix-turn-helix transcriptional regulator [Salibaculum sp.]|uniref:helix-turn-helix transcriptional regulator n=1 Tax=Salibaculum sp. TaxID=2855480 RepID=UPI002B49F95E|nr:AlpA family phage regulatory protein [Salibaculum sp.]HKL70862.1 AlpA family phage regulatory protein [Salibaculum sp.]